MAELGQRDLAIDPPAHLYAVRRRRARRHGVPRHGAARRRDAGGPADEGCAAARTGTDDRDRGWVARPRRGHEIAGLFGVALVSALLAWAPWRAAPVPAPLKLLASIGADASLTIDLGVSAILSPDGTTLALRGASQRHPPSNRGLDAAADPRGVSLGPSATVSAPGSGCDLWLGLRSHAARFRDRGRGEGATRALAESVRRARDRIDPAGGLDHVIVWKQAQTHRLLPRVVTDRSRGSITATTPGHSRSGFRGVSSLV